VPHRRFLTAAALSLLALLAGCSTAVVTTQPTPPAEPPAAGNEEVGYASWYGAQHQGKRTASGEVYDMNLLTAAHRTLPFGTRLLVTNRDTSQSAEVRVNDRGPFVKGRILDVSYAAARQLGAVGAGIFPVRLRVIALPGTRADGPAGDGGFTVQVGAFTSRARAEALRETVGGDAVISESTVAGETLYRVRVGSFPDRTQATPIARSLTSRGFQPLILSR
jgi:rare lipoprotein A